MDSHNEELHRLVKVLDMQNVSDLLLASKEDLAKCKIKDPDVTEFAINQVYTRAAQLNGVESTNAYELLTREMN
jgi:hypothetical protein